MVRRNEFPKTAVQVRIHPGFRAIRPMTFRSRNCNSLVALLCVVVSACNAGREVGIAAADNGAGPDSVPPASQIAVFEGPVPRASCGPESMPETDIQGRVSVEDRVSGRSTLGYSCNLKLVGQHQGQGSSWVSQSYGSCAYMSTHSPSLADVPGTQVIDVSDSALPRLATNLTTPGMLGTWESLKVNHARGLLAATSALSPGGNGPLFFDVYDISNDCAAPELMSSTPFPIVGHEGAWAPDGNTYYASSTLAQRVAAIDVSDPINPALIGEYAISTHGLSLSKDGNRAYLSAAPCGNGLAILDTSQIQARADNPAATIIGEVCWSDGSAAQATIPVTIGGKPYIIFFDEGGRPTQPSPVDFTAPAGAARIIDISDETRPLVISKLKLEIHMPENAELAAADVANTGIFGYQAHYCGVDREEETTALACAFFHSGVRVFDIRDPMKPREIAYFNPPAQTGKNLELAGSEHANSNPANELTADWCSSPPRFVAERGELWLSCQDNGFMTLGFTNGSWPLE